MFVFAQRTRVFWCVSLVYFCHLADVSAATYVNPGDQDLIRDRQNRLLEEQPRRLEELKDLPGKEAKPSSRSLSAARQGHCDHVMLTDERAPCCGLS